MLCFTPRIQELKKFTFHSTHPFTTPRQQIKMPAEDKTVKTPKLLPHLRRISKATVAFVANNPRVMPLKFWDPMGIL